MNIEQAKLRLKEIESFKKYEAMIHTASIITQLLAKYNIKPIIVGGLSVEIYTQNDYVTRDIDFVSDGHQIIEDVLFSLDFKKEGKNYYHSGIEIAVEIPGNDLAGSYDKVSKVNIDNENYVYLISIEDIILDRLRAAVHWNSEQDSIWGFRLLVQHFEQVDLDYLRQNTEDKVELIRRNK